MAEELETKKPSTKLGCEFAFSERLIGSPYLEEFKERVEELRDLASKLAPGGELVLSIVTNGERFRPIQRAMVNLTYMKKIYNERAIMSKPELANELGKLANILKDFNNSVDKRRAARIKERRKAQEARAAAAEAKKEKTNN